MLAGPDMNIFCYLARRTSKQYTELLFLCSHHRDRYQQDMLCECPLVTAARAMPRSESFDVLRRAARVRVCQLQTAVQARA